MSKINVTYVLCKIGGFSQYLWIADAIDRNRINLSFVFLDETTDILKDLLLAKGFTCYQLVVHSKKDIPKAIYQTLAIFKKEKTTVVHTHLIEASLVGLSAAKLAGIKKRIHTRHHADFHHQHYRKGVILDNLINYLSTDIIVISKNVQSIVEKKEKYHQNKIRLIYHGFKLEEFSSVPEENIRQLKSKYNIFGYPVIGMVSRYESGKGIEYCISAFKKLLPEYPDARLIIANAFGPEKEQIQQHLNNLPANTFTEIEYEKDIKALYKCFDIFVHVPTDATYEAFGQVYIEALSAGIPCIFTLSGVACEFIEDKKNALVVGCENTSEIYNAMFEILINKDLAEQLIETGRKDIEKYFSLSLMITKLEELYTLR